MKMLIPFTPHLAHEVLELIKEKQVNEWPKIDKGAIQNQMLNMVIQINGKTRDVIKIKRDLPEDKVVEESKKSSQKSMSFIEDIKKNMSRDQVVEKIEQEQSKIEEIETNSVDDITEALQILTNKQ